MKIPSFLNGVLLALALSLSAAVGFAALTTVMFPGLVIRLLIAGLGLIGAVAAAFFSPSLLVYLTVHVGMVWLIRALYYTAGVLPALLDLGLSALALAAAVWAAGQTGSVFLAVWSFFLVQALFVVMPRSVRDPAPLKDGVRDDEFERAHRNAEAALRRLSTRS
jgi:hypothetical protein